MKSGVGGEFYQPFSSASPAIEGLGKVPHPTLVPRNNGAGAHQPAFVQSRRDDLRVAQDLVVGLEFVHLSKAAAAGTGLPWLKGPFPACRWPSLCKE